jgi:glycerol-3-phosphate O-acyltransferase
MSGINDATHVNAVGLLAMALLNMPDQSLDEQALKQQLDIYLTLLKDAPYANDVTCVDLTASEIICYGKEFGALKRKSDVKDEQLFIEGTDAILMTYFRNNIVHLFVLPSFIACCFLSNEAVTKKQLVHWFRLVYPFLKSELSMRWNNRQLASAANKVVESFIDQGLIAQSKGLLRVTKGNEGVMHGLSGGVSLSLERFYLTVLILQQKGEGALTRFELEKICGNTAEKLSEINGLNSPEFFDKASFKGFIEMLYKEGIIWADGKGKLTYGAVLESIINDAGLVMSQQVRNNVQQIVD